MILGADNRKKWSEQDVLIMQAYQIWQSEKCSQHGGPVWLCDNEDSKLQVRVNEVSCYAKQELELAEESRKDDDKKGVVLVPEFYDLGGRDLVEFRDLYRQQKAREHAEEAEEE